MRSQGHVGDWFDLVKVEYAALFPTLPHRTRYYRVLKGLELFLTELLLVGRLQLSGLVRVSFHPVAQQNVCRIAVQAAPEPVWVTVGGAERLYVRTGNSTRELSGGEAYSYARRHWL